MTVRLGVSSSNDQGTVYDRSCGTGFVIECHEAQVEADVPTLDPFVFDLNRRGYGFLSSAWPPTTDGSTGNMERNAAAGRIAFYSHKAPTGVTWQQVANGAIDTQIDARGAEIAAWFTNHPGYSFVWSFHHEPNSSTDITAEGGGNEATAAARWRAATERIWTRWQAQGVPVWVGNQDGSTVTHGIILCGPVLVAGAQAYPASSSDPNTTDAGVVGKLNLWYGQYDSAAWVWSNIQAAGGDGYNQGPVWRAFEETFGDYPVTGYRYGFKTWSDYRKTQANNDGRNLLQTWWEFATRERGDQLNPYTSESTYWTGLATAATKANWIKHLATYFSADADDVYGVTYYDSGMGGNAGEGWMVDTSTAAWQGWLECLQDPVFGYVGGPEPPPATLYYPGVMTVNMHARLAVS